MKLQEIYIGKYLLSLITRLLPKRKKPLVVDKPKYIGMDLYKLQEDFQNCDLYEYYYKGLNIAMEVRNENGTLILFFNQKNKCVQATFYHKKALKWK